MANLYASKLWIFCVLSCLLFIECQTQECLHQKHPNNLTKYFGDKSIYVYETNKMAFKVPGYIPKQYWGIFSVDKNEFSTETYNQKSQELIKRIQQKNGCVAELKAWDYSKEEVLRNVKTTILSIATSLRKNCSNLIGDSLPGEGYVFKDAVSGKRDFITEFMKELLSRPETFTEQNFTIMDTSNNANMIKNCNNFKTNNQGAGESIKFFKRKEFQQMINDISTKLGSKTNFNLVDLKLIFELCRTETFLLKNKTSPWCSVFHEDHLKLFEYNEDLLSYYSTGYGYKYSKKIGCDLVKEMLIDLKNSTATRLKGIFTFTDSVQFQTFLTTLGVKMDSIPINADNYQTQNDYLWRTSEISPIGANFAAVLFEESKLKVKFLLNGKPISIFDCPDGLCDLDYVSEKINAFEKCTYEFCTKVDQEVYHPNVTKSTPTSPSLASTSDVYSLFTLSSLVAIVIFLI